MDSIGLDCKNIINDFKNDLELNDYSEQKLVIRKKTYKYMLQIKNNRCKCNNDIRFYHDYKEVLFDFIVRKGKRIGEYAIIQIVHTKECNLPQQDIYYNYQSYGKKYNKLYQYYFPEDENSDPCCACWFTAILSCCLLAPCLLYNRSNFINNKDNLYDVISIYTKNNIHKKISMLDSSIKINNYTIKSHIVKNMISFESATDYFV